MSNREVLSIPKACLKFVGYSYLKISLDIYHLYFCEGILHMYFVFKGVVTRFLVS